MGVRWWKTELRYNKGGDDGVGNKWRSIDRVTSVVNFSLGERKRLRQQFLNVQRNTSYFLMYLICCIIFSCLSSNWFSMEKMGLGALCSFLLWSIYFSFTALEITEIRILSKAFVFKGKNRSGFFQRKKYVFRLLNVHHGSSDHILTFACFVQGMLYKK